MPAPSGQFRNTTWIRWSRAGGLNTGQLPGDASDSAPAESTPNAVGAGSAPPATRKNAGQNRAASTGTAGSTGGRKLPG